VTLDGHLVLLAVRRPTAPFARALPPPSFAFGEPDAHGIVGEGITAWKLRESIGFVARSGAHALVTGPSGTGKELVGRALHDLSSRQKGPFVARSAATLPAGIIDAELFGNAKSYPNPGMAERPGLIGAADGGTLFLDEIGELSHELQAHLLRTLDRGEYQRLGEPTTRRADVRFVAATNRAETELKHDLAARFVVRLVVPGLDERREDVPLIARHLFRSMAKGEPSLAARFADEHGDLRTSPVLIEALVRHSYATHVRELSSLLWMAVAGSRRDYVEITPPLEAELRRRAEATPSVTGATPTLSRARIEEALAAAGGSVTKAAAALGLRNRGVLYRLMEKQGIGKD
jgi:two-component system nitrogen regulation response regulator GlnG/two-component system response regulator HydG